ncbi:MAG: PLP-dependent aminotransferase family protein [Kurthia sp.]|nr:PLP-dependent aminotransferase family protein [Candidatus Kurthia equi]
MAFHYRKLADQIAERIYSGEIKSHHKLSSLRVFAKNHHVSMTTAKSCYELLESRGLIFSKPKSGYFVKNINKFIDLQTYPEFNSYPRSITNLELQSEIQQASISHSRVHLGAIQLSPKIIPIEMLRRSIQRALKHSAPEDFLYNDLQGHLKLRQALSNHWAEDGVYIPEDSIFITHGCMSAISTVIQLLTQAGDSIIIPTPNYNGQQLLLANLGRKILEIPASNIGIDLQRLEEVMAESKAKVCLLTVNYHNPLGFCLSNTDKEKIIELAVKYQCFIIEDDIYSECGHNTFRPLPIQYWDKDGYVFLCSSISKSLSPAYRMGWLCLPYQQGHFRDRLLSLLSQVNTPLQLGLADFINSRAYRNHLNTLRFNLLNQVEEYRSFIKENFTDLEVKVTQPEGGYCLWIQLPNGVKGINMYKFAQEQGINIVPGEVFGADQKYDNFIRINAGYPLNSYIKKALTILRDWIKSQV